MKRLFEEMLAQIAQGNDMVMVSVIANQGAAPRGAGARMLVNAAGRCYGTIGGGAVELHALRLAGSLLGTNEPYLKRFALHQGAADDIGMVCGGDVEVLFQPVSAENAVWRQTALAALAALKSHHSGWLVERLPGGETDPALYLDGALAAGRAVADETLAQLTGKRPLRLADIFAEPLPTDGRVVIFGGGHVCQELLPMLVHLDYRVIVFENRAEFADPALFPGAEAVILGDYTRIHDFIDINDDDYAVVMTNGHAHDCEVEGQVLRSAAGYVGVIGSYAKIAAVNKRLLAEGITQAQLDTVYTPIGVAIQAQTPAEIAVSIAAELIQVRAHRAAGQTPAGCPMRQ